ncbi:MAG: hypothetical protein HQK53_20335, partial [Oligoflexia bacterium]|nr:hypothetical protein [Oligoflexia bacterium]
MQSVGSVGHSSTATTLFALLDSKGKQRAPSTPDMFYQYMQEHKLIVAVQERLRYRFVRIQLLINALTHRSFAHEWSLFSLPQNERLEFLGDSLL